MFEDMEGFIKPGTKEAALIKKIDPLRLPKHVAVIMDGNGRWAKKRLLPRVEGHRAGQKSVREIIEISARLGIKVLSLYAFSKENWKRPRLEVDTLWRLLEEYLSKEGHILSEKDMRLKVIGQREAIPETPRRELERVEALTRKNKRMTLVMALNYGGRAEIVDAVKKIAREPDFDIGSLEEKKFSQYLYTSDIPDPDLLIRTSGELRISNFLLWQIAYAEIWITPVLWPDFRKKHLLQAVVDYQQRERRFGDIQTETP